MAPQIEWNWTYPQANGMKWTVACSCNSQELDSERAQRERFPENRFANFLKLTSRDQKILTIGRSRVPITCMRYGHGIPLRFMRT